MSVCVARSIIHCLLPDVDDLHAEVACFAEHVAPDFIKRNAAAEASGGVTFVFDDMRKLKAAVQTLPHSYATTAQIMCPIASFPASVRKTRAWEVALLDPITTILFAVAVAPVSKQDPCPLIAAVIAVTVGL